ncbi:hypothetical protein [Lichenifustis flavocetrariae]|uniref:Uncharacterized protein n=1 Tax=Lichenifustis flavocetrariae TaxID=2949735 RepID=A0AA41YWD7_9HYPH|nr:hypothetical protein [Lichenifustis flavocetrariae]MCW6509824.1 hypothetical protein [Lichenifustis flavocetrariae]
MTSTNETEDQTDDPADLSWKAKDALRTLGVVRPNLRPGQKVSAKQVWQGSGTAGFRSNDVLDGVEELISNGILETNQEKTDVWLADDGFAQVESFFS